MNEYATFKSNINNDYEHLPYDINTKIIEFIERLQINHKTLNTDKLNIVSNGKHSSYHKIYIEYEHAKYLINKQPMKLLNIDSGILNKLVKQNFKTIVSYLVGGNNADYDSWGYRVYTRS